MTKSEFQKNRVTNSAYYLLKNWVKQTSLGAKNLRTSASPKRWKLPIIPSCLLFFLCTRLLLAKGIAICFTVKKYGYFLQHKEHLGEIPRWIPPDDSKEAQDRGCVSVLHYANRDHSIRLLLSCGDVSVQFLSVWFHFLRWIFCFRR